MRGRPLVDRLQGAGIERDVGLGGFAALEDQHNCEQRATRAPGSDVDDGRLCNHSAGMTLTNAEKQARWRLRNQIVLTDPAADIAEKLMAMADQAKLRAVASLVNDHLRNPERVEPAADHHAPDHAPPSDDDRDESPPGSYRNAFMLRADAARELAVHTGPDHEIDEYCRKLAETAAAAWTTLARQLRAAAQARGRRGR
jgi:hypothetical protein